VANERPRYLSYLLRLWQANGPPGGRSQDAGLPWRASLESPRTRERRSFKSLDDMVEFLRREIQLEEGERDADGVDT
jgi:hypothetical protein